MVEPGARILGRGVARARPLGGGCLFAVSAVDLEGGLRVVVKSGEGGLAGQLRLEARMLDDLRDAGAAVPEVLAVDDARLVLEWIEHDGGGLDAAGRRRLAADLAALHAVARPAFGYPYDTVIGALPQPNARAARWLDFFRDRRLLAPAAAARDEGVLDAATHARLERLAAGLADRLDEPAHPSLLHGDLWTGNVLTRKGRPVGWVDPAIYWGHPEIELAFARLFGPLDRAALDHYAATGGLAPGFEPTRCAIYQLYPLLIHLRLFGRTYLPAIQERLKTIGL